MFVLFALCFCSQRTHLSQKFRLLTQLESGTGLPAQVVKTYRNYSNESGMLLLQLSGIRIWEASVCCISADINDVLATVGYVPSKLIDNSTSTLLSFWEKNCGNNSKLTLRKTSL